MCGVDGAGHCGEAALCCAPDCLEHEGHEGGVRGEGGTGAWCAESKRELEVAVWGVVDGGAAEGNVVAVIAVRAVDARVQCDGVS